MTRAIAKIDQDITANQRELCRRAGRFDRLDAAAWQAAWDHFPELSERQHRLYEERGQAQQERDEAAYRLAMGERRSAAPKAAWKRRARAA